MDWTKEQSKVIDTREKNILVSAAAGSGKTTVLVERIIQRICDSQNPIDIDKILVVTFTNAAAAQMKEKIYKALSAVAEDNPEDERLQKQLALCFNARISTIDSFCIYLIRNYFHETGIEPNMVIADETQAEDIKASVMKDMLEEYYCNRDEQFIKLCNDYAKRDKDGTVENMIYALYKEADSYPYENEFYEQLKKVYNVDSPEQLNDSGWMKEFLLYAKGILEGVLTEAKGFLEELITPDRHPYADVVESDIAIIERLLEFDKYEDYQEFFTSVSFARAPSKLAAGEEKEEREIIKAKRDAIKKEINDLKKLFSEDIDKVFDDVIFLKPHMNKLVDLTADFSKRYKKEKADRKIMEFSDVEHYALNILIDPNTKERTKSAKMLSKEFEEIMVDEYQDSNLLQEIILSAMTGEWMGKYNYFMVGDVKQSIYRFRQARPDIFTGKYSNYKKAGLEYETVIDLDNNFRSRREVVDSVNAVFEKLMKPDIGGVDYDKKAALKYGASYEEDSFNYKTNVIISDSSNAKEAGFNNKEEYEAYIIARKIKDLLEEKKFKLSDMVILHRSANTVGSTYKDILKQFDIPAVVVNNTGYFSSVEVEVFIALMKVLANPRQDIALASVMKSVMFNFTDEELEYIHLAYGEYDFYEAVLMLAKEDEAPEGLSEEIYDKCVSFVKKISEWRVLSNEVSVYRLIQMILSETGYLTYVSAMPEGEIRRDNIDKLLSLAIAYNNTGSCNIRDFVRYVEKMDKYERQIPAAQATAVDAVSIMTIHKSKGLEFPVVILAGAGRQFKVNKDTLVIGKDIGMATEIHDGTKRIKQETLIKNAISKKIYMEDLGEEQRVLYVAMTRAMEKLIITGVENKTEKLLDKSKESKGKFTFATKALAKSFMQWILPVAMHREDVFDVEYLSWEDLLGNQAKEEVRFDMNLAELKEAVEKTEDKDIAEFAAKLEFKYPREINTETKIKYSVSELKRRAMEETLDEDEVVSVFSAESEEKYEPLFISQKTHHVSGALRGTAVHRYMECFDFSKEDRDSIYDDEMKRMLDKGLLLQDEADLLVKKEIKIFLESELCERMHKAQISGVLKKEAAFIMKGDGDILIQGIIDVFFEEDDGIVLVDYKTDRIDNDDQLVARYKKQMELYSDAISRTHKKPVKEVILYSFCLGRSVYV